jgi:hypothetical protein
VDGIGQTAPRGTRQTLVLPVDDGVRSIFVYLGREQDQLVTTVDQRDSRDTLISRNSINLPLDVLLLETGATRNQEEKDLG